MTVSVHALTLGVGIRENMNINEELDDLVRGVAHHVFEAEEAFALLEYIGTNSKELNRATYGQFFGSIQRLLNRQLMLSVSKVFERNQKYRIRSVPNALNFMESNKEKLEIPEKPYLIKKLARSGVVEELASPDKEIELTELVINYMWNSVLSDPKIQAVQEKLKGVRDRRLAHDEVVEPREVAHPTYAELEALLTPAKIFIELVGMPFTSVAYASVDFDHFLSSDAKRSTICLRRMLEKHQILDVEKKV